MRGFDDVSSSMEETKNLLPRRRRASERQLFVLVDPVPWDGDRRDVSIAGESADLAGYEVFWDCRNPNSAWASDGGMIWAWWMGAADPVNDNTSDWSFGIGERSIWYRLTSARPQAYAASSGRACVDQTSNFPSCLRITRYASQTRAIAGYGTPPGP